MIVKQPLISYWPQIIWAGKANNRLILIQFAQYPVTFWLALVGVDVAGLLKERFRSRAENLDVFRV